MGPIEYFTDEEIQEFVFRIGDVIQDIKFSDKVLPDEHQTAFLMLQTAHSYWAERCEPSSGNNIGFNTSASKQREAYLKGLK